MCQIICILLIILVKYNFDCYFCVCVVSHQSRLFSTQTILGSHSGWPLKQSKNRTVEIECVWGDGGEGGQGGQSAPPRFWKTSSHSFDLQFRLLMIFPHQFDRKFFWCFLSGVLGICQASLTIGGLLGCTLAYLLVSKSLCNLQFGGSKMFVFSDWEFSNVNVRPCFCVQNFLSFPQMFLQSEVIWQNWCFCFAMLISFFVSVSLLRGKFEEREKN